MLRCPMATDLRRSGFSSEEAGCLVLGTHAFCEAVFHRLFSKLPPCPSPISSWLVLPKRTHHDPFSHHHHVLSLLLLNLTVSWRSLFLRKPEKPGILCLENSWEIQISCWDAISHKSHSSLWCYRSWPCTGNGRKGFRYTTACLREPCRPDSLSLQVSFLNIYFDGFKCVGMCVCLDYVPLSAGALGDHRHRVLWSWS